MNLAHFLIVLVLSGSVVLLVILLLYLLARTTHFHKKNASLLLYILSVLTVWVLVIGWNHVVHPQQHRLFYDEDAYANMAHNILDSYGVRVTKAWTGETKLVRKYKWPLGFPTLMTPFVLWFGTEKGPAIFNECCGALTLLVLMVLSARLASSGLAAYIVLVLYGLHPVVFGWYRSGSSEALAVFMLILSVWAAVESYYRSKVMDGSCADWMVVSWIAGLLAMQIRLENVIIAFSILWLYRKSRVSFSRRHWVILLLAGAPLVLSYVGHLLTLKRYYRAKLSESSFSAAYFLGNLSGNLEFLLRYSPWALILFTVVTSLIYVRMVKAKGRGLCDHTGWIALILVPLAHFAVLLLYSAGRYDLPGGSRFFLVQMAGLSVIAAALLMKLTPYKYRYWVMVAGAIFCFYLLPDRTQVWQSLNSQNSSPAIEHELIRKWSVFLPDDAIIISHLPYVWENFGRFSISPDCLSQVPIPHLKTIYEHHGLFDGSGQLIIEGGVAIDSALTRDGEISLYRQPLLPKNGFLER